MEEVCGAICEVLKKDISALCAGTVRPPEMKEAMILSFTQHSSRGDLGVLKSCFQLQV